MRTATPVNIIILNDKGQVLLAKRAEKEDQFTGRWSIPGGGPEIGETYEEALRREIAEELGCEITEKRYFKSFYFIVNPELHVRSMYFYGSIKGEVKLCDELSEWRWFDLDCLSDIEIAYNQREILQEFANAKRES